MAPISVSSAAIAGRSMLAVESRLRLAQRVGVRAAVLSDSVARIDDGGGGTDWSTAWPCVCTLRLPLREAGDASRPAMHSGATGA
jgi:hypothetical protein